MGDGLMLSHGLVPFDLIGLHLFAPQLGEPARLLFTQPVHLKFRQGGCPLANRLGRQPKDSG